MLVNSILMSVALIAIAVGAYTDLRTREVPDWVNFALIFTGIGVRLLVSIIRGEPSYVLEGLFGFGFFFAVAVLLFFAGQWGGGDSKLLMGLGATVGLSYAPLAFKESGMALLGIAGVAFAIIFGLSVFDPVEWIKRHFRKGKRYEKTAQQILQIVMIIGSLSFIGPAIAVLDPESTMLYFLFNLLLVGGIYGLLWSVYLVLQRWRRFTKELRRQLEEARPLHRAVLALASAGILISIVLFFWVSVPMALIALPLFVGVLVLFYLWFAIRTAEKVCMIKKVDVTQLTEGDWIVHDVRVNGRYICGPADLGVGREQIERLKRYKERGKIDKVTIKEGVPFVPSFLIAFIITWIEPAVFLMPLLGAML